MSSNEEPEALPPAAESQPTPPPALTPAAEDKKSDNPELDLHKLQSLPAEQQELFLLTFVTDLTKYVRQLDADDCSAQQFYLKKEIFRIINLAAPQPSRVIRNNLGQCLAHVFTHGDRKLLFETINDLAGVISGAKSKSDTETRAKHAAVVCLGDVYAAAGDSAIGLHQLCCTALVKLLKSSSNNAGLRAAIFTALVKMTGIVEGSMDESIARDIWKQGRNHASSDKGPLVVVAASQCLKALLKHTIYFRNSSDFDRLETAMFKAFDSSSSQVRHAAASCLAEAYAHGYSESASSKPTKNKKTNPKLKRQSTLPGMVGDDDEIPSRTASPAPGAKRKEDLALSLGEILRQLAAQYVKPTTPNRARAAIGVCFGKLFRRLGESVVEPNYLLIVDTLTTDILGNTGIANNRYRLLISRRIIDTLLHDVIGNKILGESGQIKIAEVLINSILKNYPAALPERPEPSKQTLITALRAVAALIQSLGSATNKFAESCRDGLLQVFQHPSYSVQVFASQWSFRFSPVGEIPKGDASA
ncbi:HEAT repeat-containing protein 5B [Beauveria bassiana]|uniref:HEAT repeat-containing protein 5B n=1 Tax=Beauveria bassiana TaxID=176275 RepID=A0A2N6NRR2_BEABA|nr:HEAT repeat-containing protein 5B [Beauveria bassiana]